MTKTLRLALVSAFLFALLVAPLAASGPVPNPQEAARLNNIGVAYMNQQLFEKALKTFEEAAANDPSLEVADRQSRSGAAQPAARRRSEGSAGKNRPRTIPKTPTPGTTSASITRTPPTRARPSTRFAALLKSMRTMPIPGISWDRLTRSSSNFPKRSMLSSTH